jgi:predicted DNA-binding transcriptional regulator YafY
MTTPLDLVKIAHQDQWQLHIVYQTENPSGVQTERDIDVYAFDEEYIDAYCRLRKKVLKFCPHRIRGAWLLSDRFTREPEIELEITRSGWSRMARQCHRPCCQRAPLGVSQVPPPTQESSHPASSKGRKSLELIKKILTLGLVS